MWELRVFHIHSSLDKLQPADQNRAVGRKVSRLVRPIPPPGSVSFGPDVCPVFGQVGPALRGADWAELHPDHAPYSSPSPGAPFPRSRRKQMESGRNQQLLQPWSRLLDGCSKYKKKNKIVTSYWRFSRRAFNPHNNPVVALWHYCSYFTDAKTSPESVSSHAHHLSPHPHTC